MVVLPYTGGSCFQSTNLYSWWHDYEKMGLDLAASIYWQLTTTDKATNKTLKIIGKDRVYYNIPIDTVVNIS